MAGRDRSLEQVQGPGDIGVDEGLRRVTCDVGLVESAGMNDGLDAMIGEGAVDEAAVGDGSEDLGLGAGRDVQAGYPMAMDAQQGSQEAT